MRRRPLTLLALAAAAIGAAAGCGPALTALGVVGLEALEDDEDDPFDVPPAVSVTTPAGNVNHTIPITYRLSDPDALDRASVTIQYSVGNGAFQPATQAFSDGAEGTQDLTTSPTGAEHVFLWNSAADLGLQNEPSVRVRVTATDAGAPIGPGSSATTGSFAVLNAYITTLARAPTPPGTSPVSLAVDPGDGDLIVADSGGSRIVRVDRATGATSVAAGTGESGYNGQNIAGPTALLNRPLAVAIDPSDGDIIVADSQNARVRRIDATSGFISDLVGDGSRVDDDYATEGILGNDVAIAPRDVVLDAAGNPFILGREIARVRVLNREALLDLLFPTNGAIPFDPVVIGPGRLASVVGALPSTGSTNALTAEPEDPIALAVRDDGVLRLVYGLERGRPGATAGSTGAVWVANFGAAPVDFSQPSPAPALTVQPGEIRILVRGAPLPNISPFGDLALADAQVVVVAAGGDGALYAVNFSPAPATVAGTTIAAGDGAVVAGVPGQAAPLGDGQAPLSARLFGPFGVAMDGQAIFVGELDGRVRVIAPPGQAVTVGDVTVAAGTVGTVGVILPGTTGAVIGPLALARAQSGDLLIGDAASSDPRSLRLLRASAADGSVTTLAGTGVLGDLGDGGPGAEARVGAIAGIAEDPARRLVVFSDVLHHRVRAVNTGSAAVTYLGTTIAPGAIETVVGTGQRSADPLSVGDGGPPAQATLSFPSLVFIDARGLLWVSDSGDDRVRVCNPGGAAVTVLGTTIAPGEVETVIGTGAQGDPLDDGDGGPAGAARLDSCGATLGPDGNVWLLDGIVLAFDPLAPAAGEARVRVVNLGASPLTVGGVTVAPGEIETVCGAGQPRLDDGSNLGDGGPALGATFRSLSALAVRADGLAFISDADDDRVRVANLSASTVTVLGVALPPGRIETLLGAGIPGFSGDPTSLGATFSGGAAGLIEDPQGLLLRPGAGLLVADGGNGAVRLANLGDAPTSFAGRVAGPGEVVVVAGSRAGRVRAQTPRAVVAEAGERVLFSDLGQLNAAPAILQLDPDTRIVTRAVGTQVRTNASGSNLGDGGPALLATLAEPLGLALAPADAALLIADAGNQRLRWVNRSGAAQTVGAVTIDPGHIDTVADGRGNFDLTDDDGQPLVGATDLDLIFPSSVALSGSVIWVCDEGTDRVLRLDTGLQVVQGVWAAPGRVTAVAAQDATTAYVAVRDDQTGGAAIVLLQYVGPGFTATAVAGTFQREWNGDALAATAMNLGEVRGLALDGALLVATDLDTNRVIAMNLGAGTATFAGVTVPAGAARMVAGAGQGDPGFNGDAIPPDAALLNQPTGITITPLGGVVVVDTANARVRRFQR